MPRLDKGDEAKIPISAEARRWWLAPMALDEGGRNDELEASGVLFRLPAIWLTDMLGGGGTGRVRSKCGCEEIGENSGGAGSQATVALAGGSGVAKVLTVEATRECTLVAVENARRSTGLKGASKAASGELKEACVFSGARRRREAADGASALGAQDSERGKSTVQEEKARFGGGRKKGRRRRGRERWLAGWMWHQGTDTMDRATDAARYRSKSEPLGQRTWAGAGSVRPVTPSARPRPRPRSR